MTILLIIGGILLELIVLVFGVYLLLKYFKKPEVTSYTSRDEIQSVLMELMEEKEQPKPKNIRIKQSEVLYSTGVRQETPVKRSGGNLVPYGLSDDERDVLEMFYDN